MAELLHAFEPEIESITLIASDGGHFEVTVNGNLIYSKLETHRHANEGEVNALIQKILLEENDAY
jgi:selT/selW/selH-like putative selenoprotein